MNCKLGLFKDSDFGSYATNKQLHPIEALKLKFFRFDAGLRIEGIPAMNL